MSRSPVLEARSIVDEQRIVYVIELISKALKIVRPQQLLLARHCRIQNDPLLIESADSVNLHFEYLGIDQEQTASRTDAGEVILSIPKKIITALGLYGAGAIAENGSSPIQSNCDCDNPSPCLHSVAALEDLRKKLTLRSHGDAAVWFNQRSSDGSDLGKSLYESLQASWSNSTPTPDDEDEMSVRLQWRLSGFFPDQKARYNARSTPTISCVLQSEKRRGGWTKGRELRNILEAAPANAYQHPNDRMIATMVEMSHRSYAEDYSRLLREILWLLPGHSSVAAENMGEYEPVSVVIEDITLSMEEDGEMYRPRFRIADFDLDHSNDRMALYELGRGRQMVILADRARRSLIASEIDPGIYSLMSSMAMTRSRFARFDHETAERFADLLALQAKQRSVQLELPQSLAGPEQQLEPKIELHLVPRQPAGLTVMLRVGCESVDEAPIPGVEPERLRVATAAGRFQLLRDLAAESRLADEWVENLGLQSMNYDGPYTWIAATDDAALDLLSRVQAMGDAAITVCWPKSQQLRLVGELMPRKLQVRLSSQKDWFGLEGFAEIDGIQIPLAELLAALRAGRRFIPLGNSQFAAISDQLRQRLRAIADVAQNDSGPVKIGRAAMPIVEEALGDDMDLVTDVHWQESLQRMKDAQALVPELPTELKADLRDYQKSGFEWLSRLSTWRMGAVLADDMGLGKTVQALGVLLQRGKDGPALIVAPTSVGGNWVRETQRFAPSLNAQLYREQDRQTLIESAAPNDLIIVSYQLLQRDVERFASRPWHTLVLDEAQFIKNYQTKTSQAVRRLETDWQLALSGTPLENHLGELWSLLRVICPGLLGSWERFRKQFAEPIERDRDRDRLDALGRLVRPFILRRTKREVLQELPPRNEIVQYAELSENERKKYDAARMAALSDLTAGTNGEPDQQKRIRVLAWLTKLRQLSCHPRLVDPRWPGSSAKMDMLMEIVDELREGEHRALVFSQFVQHLTLVRQQLDRNNIPYQYLDGSTPASKRQDAIDAFQAGEGDLFLISLKAGGTGLNLTAADYVIHLDPWWNPAVEDQATDRAHRIGQERSVTVYRLVAKDTIEEQILALHEEKRELISGVLDGADRAGKMSSDDLINLIRLSSTSS